MVGFGVIDCDWDCCFVCIRYVLIAVFIIVGCFVAAIVATQITFVSEKHKLVQEEKAHEAMEVVLEKRFLEVRSMFA